MNRAFIIFIALTAASLLLLMPVATVHAAGLLTVNLDKQSYKAGDTITVTGKAHTSDPIVIQVYNPNGDPYRVDQIKPEASGSYTYKLKVGGPLGINGEFEVEVVYLNSFADAKFTLTGGKEPTKKPAVASLFKATKPLKAGKSITFTLPGAIKSAGWTLFDDSMQLEKGTATTSKK